jgi:hypothetical protein
VGKTTSKHFAKQKLEQKKIHFMRKTPKVPKYITN